MRPLIDDREETALAKKMQLASIIRSEFLPKANRTGKQTAPHIFKGTDDVLAHYDKFKSKEEVKEEEPLPVK